eukprot:3082785-Pyramimonas_sp.AAC.1
MALKAMQLREQAGRGAASGARGDPGEAASAADDSETRSNAPSAAMTDGAGRGSKRSRRRSNRAAHGQMQPRAETDAGTPMNAKEMTQEQYEAMGW